MGNAHAQHGRLAGVALATVVLLAALLMLATGAQQASAYDTYQHGGAVCANCHNTMPMDNAQCTTCHTGFAAPWASSECWSCHTPGQNVQAVKTGAPTSCTATCHLASGTNHTHNPHPGRGTCTTAGCHNVTVDDKTPNGSPHHIALTIKTTTLTAKVVPATVALGRKVKVTGVAQPAGRIAGAKIGFKLERKVGTKWVRIKAPASATVGLTGTCTWTYKPVKRGTYKVTLTVKATERYTAKTLVKTFKVK